MAYAAKTASAFYGPFREAADSAPPSATGAATRWTRRTAARRCARWRWTSRRAPTSCWSSPPCRSWTSSPRHARRFDLPIAAYQVAASTRWSTAAAERGWIDGRAAMTESVTAIVRAGAGIVITYAAADLAGWLRERGPTP